MFTGLVEEVGEVEAAGVSGGGFELSVKAGVVLDGVALGDSISVNGVCLTVTRFDPARFTVGLAPETLKRTNLGDLKPGDKVNLERAALPTTRLGGHYVQGHVDATGVISSFRPDGDALWLTVKTPPSLMRYIVSKGYIALDGASLTVVDVGDDWFNVTLIAYSQQKLALTTKRPGERVNLEVDILAKYVERLMSPAPQTQRLSREFLTTHGFTKEGASS
ncbi:MAG: riboflavin synthase [Parvularculaceae bacterium]|nr:riboflavin synthase [Parvularculaceae bacterium]